MKYLRKFNESIESDADLELIDDYLVEYLDKYGITDEKNYGNSDINYKGYYTIKECSTEYFRRERFPDGKRGYQLQIYFNKEGTKIIHNTEMDKLVKEEWKEDMMKFINRVCKLGYKYKTSANTFTYGITEYYYIAFFK